MLCAAHFLCDKIGFYGVDFPLPLEEVCTIRVVDRTKCDMNPSGTLLEVKSDLKLAGSFELTVVHLRLTASLT